MYVSMGSMVGLPLPKFLKEALVFAITQAIIALCVVVVNFAYYTVGYKNLYTFFVATDTRAFSTYIKGEYFEIYPKNKTTGKILLLVEEMHRYHINFYKNFKWNDYMYEGLELGIDLKK